MNLKEVSEEINELLENRRKDLRISFVEEKHIYYMMDKSGKIRSNFPSVSKIIKKFHKPFDADKISLKLANGDKLKQQEILNEWKMAADMGSRTHFLLEQYTIDRYKNNKIIRQPIFECNEDFSLKSDKMFIGGKKFIDLMDERGAIHLGSEVIMGSNDLGYLGQCDDIWTMMNKNNTELCLIISDYKTNSPKNFIPNSFNGKMVEPFNKYDDYTLIHYYLQIPFYGRLLIDMLKGTKYENIKYCGGVVVHLKEDETFTEYRVPQDINKMVFNMDLTKYTESKW